ncbi:MAG: DUF445 domain-containing protein [Leptothrix sp. (in: b-proteobacteria)]
MPHPDPAVEPDPSLIRGNGAARLAELQRMRWLATGLLLLMVLLFLLARWQGRSGHMGGSGGWGGWALLAAFAEAAMIGALADWFAVVALFRRPLGLPIPHTAIIPQRKAQLADSFATFVRDKFLDTDSLLGKLRQFQPIDRLGAWLAAPHNLALLGARLQQALAGLLDCIDDRRIRRLLTRAVHKRLEQIDLARLVGDLLATLTADRRHQELLDQTLRALATWLDREEVQKSLAGMLLELLGREYPRTLKLVGTVASVDDMGQKIATAAVRGLNKWLHEICDDPEHPRRRDFDLRVEAFIAKLRHDPDFAARIEATKFRLIHDPAVTRYVQGLWNQLHRWLQQDLQGDDSRLRSHFVQAAAMLGRTLTDNQALRSALHEHLETSVRQLAPELRQGIAQHIARTVKGWDDAQLVRELEISVGRDLQFIRLNGTLVGGLIGLGIHTLDRWLF